MFRSLSVGLGDEEEWDQQCFWHSELMSGLDKVDVCVDQLQQDQEKWTTRAGDWSINLHAMVRAMSSRFIIGTGSSLVD